MKSLIVILGVVALMTTTLSFSLSQDDPWKVPEKYEKMKNPVVADDASIKAGNELYITHCRSCHGIKGKGEGKRATNLNTTPADFTSASFKNKQMAHCFIKFILVTRICLDLKKEFPGNEDVIEGSFGKTRSPGDLINYLRTFAKQ